MCFDNPFVLHARSCALSGQRPKTAADEIPVGTSCERSARDNIRNLHDK
jgi:hypothetical protein